ncbi:hypothetical protein RI367_001994 [Sorochytrium milnesiophthora]
MPAQKITLDLLRRRAEHNDGELSTLEEITLHQFDIEKIENLEHCRKLKILYLQHNQITKIENLNKLKALEYLNLALNNITKIENLQGCESLRKLDLTVNFVSDLTCVDNLKPCENLRELHLTGNPVTQVEGYREYVIATLPQLEVLDGVPVRKSNKLTADQQLPGISEQIVNGPPPETFQLPDSATLDAIDQQDTEAIAHEFQHGKSDHTPAARLIAARQLSKLRESKKGSAGSTEPGATKKKKKLDRVGPNGEVMQCNEGKYEYKFVQTRHLVVLEVGISKFLDTSLIDIDVQEGYVRVDIKDKRLQLCLEQPVIPGMSVPQRSQATGKLSVYMVLQTSAFASAAGVHDALDVQAMEDRENRKQQEPQKPPSVTDYRNIVPKSGAPTTEGDGKRTISVMRTKIQRPAPTAVEEDFIDDPDVPPLV